MYAFGGFELRAGSCELLRSSRPTDLQLVPTRLLLYLVENRERVVPKTELLAEIWPDTLVSESAFTTAVGRIRHQLGDEGATQRFIRARRGRGYQFVAEVEERYRPPPTLLDGSVRALAFEARDWVLIAAFDNHAGEALFEGTLEAALARELSNSRFVNVVPRERIQDTLRLMKKPFDTRVDGEVGREICLRDGGIRALLTGRVDKLGSAYLLSVGLVDPTQGLTVASLSETAEGEEQVLSALRRLATITRETLGEEIRQFRTSNEELETVSTTSLRALQLFTQADAEISKRKNDVAEVLLKRAVEEDPEFASAYNHLAHSLRNQGRPPEEFVPYARMALELSEQLPERERYFIEGSYYSFVGQDERAITSYEALLQLHPDHFWANSNLRGALYRVGRYEEVVPHVVQWAALQPYNFLANWNAGRWLATAADDPAEAAPYFARTSELIPPLSDRPGTGFPNATAVALLYPTLELWLAGDLELLIEELESWEDRLPSMYSELRRAMAWQLFLAYRSLGQHRADLGVIAGSAEDDRNMRAVDAFDRNDRATLYEILEETARGSHARVWMLARSGFLAEAREAITEFDAADNVIYKDNSLLILRGQLTLAEGDTDTAISLLEEGLPLERFQTSFLYLVGSVSLSRALWQKGERVGAVGALQRTSEDKRRLYDVSLRLLWMKVQFELAERYHELGYEGEAGDIETDLLELLAYADPDFPLLLKLQDRS